MCCVLSFLTGAPGPGELIVIFLVVLVLFGPKRLPQVARMLGRALDELRRASHDFRRQVMDIEQEPGDEKPHPESLPPPYDRAEQQMPRQVTPEEDDAQPPGDDANGNREKHDLAG